MTDPIEEAFETWWKANRCQEHPHSHPAEKSWAKAGYEAGASAQREKGIQAVAATRLVGPGNDSAYQLGFTDACSDIERRIREGS